MKSLLVAVFITLVSLATASYLGQSSIMETEQLTPAQLARVDEIWNGLRNHIFNGEASTTSGRHMLKKWCSDNKKSAGVCNLESRICIFDEKKTVWDDRPGGYTQANVEALCKEAIGLNLGAGSLKTRAFAVKTTLNVPNKRPICVEHAVHNNQDSCYPKGINFRQSVENMGPLAIGDICPGAGTGNEVAPMAPHEAVNCKDVR